MMISLDSKLVKINVLCSPKHAKLKKRKTQRRNFLTTEVMLDVNGWFWSGNTNIPSIFFLKVEKLV